MCSITNLTNWMCSRCVTLTIVNGDYFGLSETAVLLGHLISTRDNDFMDYAAKPSFWRPFHLFLGTFYSSLENPLFNLHCCSYYWASLWSLRSNGADDVCVTWRKSPLKYSEASSYDAL